MRKGRIFKKNAERVNILGVDDNGLEETVAKGVRMLIVPLPLAPQEVVAAVRQAGRRVATLRANAVLEAPRNDIKRFHIIQRADGTKWTMLRDPLMFGGEQQLELERQGIP